MRTCPRCFLSYGDAAQLCGLDGTPLIDTNVDPMIGRSLGRYRIFALLGAGAAGRVYRAQQVELGRKCAVKVLSGEMSCHRRVIARLEREAQAASAINHPNVVAVTDAGTTPEGVTYIVMELLHGQTLAQLLRKGGPLAPKRAANVVRQIADGLFAAHGLGFVHRDLKPSNIMIMATASGEHVKILDFGLVASIPSDEANQTRLTRHGHLVGTPQYMAPEVILEAEDEDRPVSPASDLYALGAILHEMLSGHPPFQGNLSDVIAHHLHSPPPALPDCGGLEQIAYALMSKDPMTRPISAREVLKMLSVVEVRGRLSNEPALDRAEALSKRRASLSRIAGIGAVVAAVCAATWISASRFSPNDPQPPAPEQTASIDKAPMAPSTEEPPFAEATPTPEATEASAVPPEPLPRPAHPAPRRSSRAPKRERRVERAAAPRTEATEEQVVELRVNTQPEGAAVFNDAGKLGETPLAVVLKKDHPTLLRMKLDGYREHTFTWTPQWKARSILVRLERDP
jgi:eukaryotic-like serine/threonine-protein kinase